jgi:peroxiredoxin
VCALFVSLALLFSSDHSAAQGPAPAFPDPAPLTLAPRTLTDRAITGLFGTLDAMLTRPGDAAAWGTRAEAPLGEFVRQFEGAELTPAQEARVLAHLDALAGRHPQDVELVKRSRAAVKLLRVGKLAPEIVGADLDGREMRLSEYRGKVVVLMFSAEWCGICRTQEPYERLMLEMYKNWPLAIVTVETGESPKSVKQSKTDARLNYRSWWDGNPTGQLGPIASAWNVTGFPRTFLIDTTGVIRFVDLRDEDLLKGVRQLLSEND